METEYKASATMKEFHRDNSFVRCLLGPIGSGKSVACAIEILRRACQQEPNKDNVRRSRWLIVRNTYSELRDTTMRTFFEWIPKDLGHLNNQAFQWFSSFTPGDGTIVELEVFFRALDRPQDIRKLLSLELTGVWLNEVREIPKAVLDMSMGRVGRFPPRKEVESYWHGIIMDTNPCDIDHWVYRSFEEKRPDSWKLFHQPSGLSEEAENRDHLPQKYYENMLAGKTQEWIKVYVHGQYGFVSDGKPVYPEFNDDVHVAKEIIKPNPDYPIIVGIDFGLTPAATINQQVEGQWRVVDEVVTERMGALNFGGILSKKINAEYFGYQIELYGDPAGEQSAQTDENTPFQILHSIGIFAQPAPTNDWTIRREAVAKLLSTLSMTAQPALLVSPKARMFRKGLGGGYKYRRMMVVGSEQYHDKPDKHSIYSHVCDAHQYAVVGCGEGYEILGYVKDWDISVNRVQ